MHKTSKKVKVDVNPSRIQENVKRRELGIPEDAFLILSIGELIPRKNHIQAIKSVAKILSEKKDINLYYAICGRGKLLNELKQLCVNLEIQDRVRFLGYRNDIAKILKISDLFLFTSFQEGLPKSLMEAMAAGLPVIATRIRGNIDLPESVTEVYQKCWETQSCRDFDSISNVHLLGEEPRVQYFVD